MAAIGPVAPPSGTSMRGAHRPRPVEGERCFERLDADRAFVPGGLGDRVLYERFAVEGARLEPVVERQHLVLARPRPTTCVTSSMHFLTIGSSRFAVSRPSMRSWASAGSSARS